jgi:sulfite reductase alpha subunit-like flavoprotein
LSPSTRYTPESPALARVRESRRLTPEGSADIRHVVIGFDRDPFPYVEGQALGLIIPRPGVVGSEPIIRYYGIASAHLGDDGQGDSASICVKRADGSGGGSAYLCELSPGDSVGVVGPFGPSFPLPENREAPLIMVATGTGVASFRGLLRRIYEGPSAWPGLVRLDHGVRSRGEAIYHDEFEALSKNRGFAHHLAVSRETGGSKSGMRRVDQSVAADSESLWRMLHEQDASLYICGVLGMEQRVEAVFAERASRAGLDWKAVRRDLLSRGRLRISTS